MALNILNITKISLDLCSVLFVWAVELGLYICVCISSCILFRIQTTKTEAGRGIGGNETPTACLRNHKKQSHFKTWQRSCNAAGKIHRISPKRKHGNHTK